MRTHSTRMAIGTLTLGLALTACGSSTPETTPTPASTSPGQSDTDAGSGDPFATCPVGVPDCNDTPMAPDSDPNVDPASGSGDRFMSDEVPVVTSFVDPSTRIVEMAPGSVEESFTLFLQEAVVDGTMVTVSFSGGEAPCFVVERVEAEESQDEVIVRVFAGAADPEAENCETQEITTQAVSFTLETELGSRPIRDGSRLVQDNANA